MESFSHPPNPFPLEHRDLQAVSHPVRTALLGAFAERRLITASEALDLLLSQGDRTSFGVLTLARINYHVRVLEREGLVEAVGLPGLQQGLPFEATGKGVEVMAAIGMAQKSGD